MAVNCKASQPIKLCHCWGSALLEYDEYASKYF
jgi:hypothetical protein